MSSGLCHFAYSILRSEAPMGRVSKSVAFRVLFFLFLTTASLHAQHEYDVWQFGDHFGLDFRGGDPVVSKSMIAQDEGCASICDRKTGAPLFYTDGVTVWNRNNSPMPNGTALFGHRSSAQSAVIVPMPHDPDRYYLFTADQQGYDPSGPTVRGVNYSIVDMRRDGGLGDVVEKNIPVQASASERLTAVQKGNGEDYWVITHSVAGNTFFAWSVTDAGVSATPVVSRAGVDQGSATAAAGLYTLGVVKASPNGRKLAVTTYSLDMVELFDFNPATGRVLNGVLLYRGDVNSGGTFAYGVSFSPNNTKLYHGMRGDLVQYDITSGDPARIIASRRTIAPYGGGGASIIGSMQTAPDGRIYLILDSVRVGVINQPNAQGDAAGYTPRWKKFAWNGIASLGLPNNIDARSTPRSCDSLDIDILPRGPLGICHGEKIVLTADVGVGIYRWSTGETTRAITVDKGGTYSVTLFDSLGATSTADVLVEEVPWPQPVIVGPSEFCKGTEVTLAATPDTAVQRYRWSTGETTSSITVRSGGTYSLTAWNRNGCSHDTSYTVVMDSLPTPYITGELLFCDHDESQLDAGEGYAAYLWSTGDTTQKITVRRAGFYTVQVRNSSGCSGSSPTVEVRTNPSPTPLLSGGTKHLCDGESIVLEAPDGYTSWLWSTGETTRQIKVNRSGLYNLVVTDEAGCHGLSNTDTVIVHPPLAKPTIISVGGLLTSSDAAAWQWYQEGIVIPSATSRSYSGATPGVYSVAIVDSNGCRATSDPFTVESRRKVWFDTVQARVGEAALLRMRVSPPLSESESISGFSIKLKASPKGLWVIGDATERASTLERLADGELLLRRSELSETIVGGELFALMFEGLATGLPENIVEIESVTLHRATDIRSMVLSLYDDSVVIAGGGMVVLSGCDIAHGFGFGKRGRLGSVAPNPSHGGMVVTYTIPEGTRPRLKLVDMAGREIRRFELPLGTGAEESLRIDIPSIATGFYMLELADGIERDILPVMIMK